MPPGEYGELMVKWTVSEITKRSRSSLKVILPLTPSPGHRFHRFLTTTSGVIQHLRGLDSVVWLWRQESSHWYPHVPPEHGLVPSLPPRILPSWPMELHLSRDMNRETSWIPIQISGLSWWTCPSELKTNWKGGCGSEICPPDVPYCNLNYVFDVAILYLLFKEVADKRPPITCCVYLQTYKCKLFYKLTQTLFYFK